MSEWISRDPSFVELGVRYTDPFGRSWTWALMKGADARWRRVRTKWAEYTQGDDPSLTPDGLWGEYISGDAPDPMWRGWSGKVEDDIDETHNWGEGMLNEPFQDGSLTVTTPIPGSTSVIEDGDKAAVAWTTGNSGASAGSTLPRPGASAYSREFHGTYKPEGRPELVETREVESTISMTHVYWDVVDNRIGEMGVARDGVEVPDGYRVEYADDAEWLEDEWTWTVEIRNFVSSANRQRDPSPGLNAAAHDLRRCLLYVQDGPAGLRARMPHPLTKTASLHYNDVYPPNWPLSLFPSLRKRADNPVFTEVDNGDGTTSTTMTPDIAAWPYGQIVWDGVIGAGSGTQVVTFTTPGGPEPHYITGAEVTFGALTGVQQTGILGVPVSGWGGWQEASVTTRILSVKRLRKHASYRFVKDTAGQYRLRQRQSTTGTDSWPLRQRQNGAHSGSWPLRQRQTGV